VRAGGRILAAGPRWPAADFDAGGDSMAQEEFRDPQCRDRNKPARLGSPLAPISDVSFFMAQKIRLLSLQMPA